jgi:hypothetical protein
MSMTGIGEIANLATSIVGKIWPDASQAQKDALTLELAQMQAQTAADAAQTSVNQAEAGNASVFVAGWRPFIGWVCGSAFAWTFVLGPMVSYAAKLAGVTVQLPVLDLSELTPVLLGMLGLGAMRTVEKVNGIRSGH